MKWSKNEKELEKLRARYIAHGVRNSYLETLHSGISPSTKTGDYSDVKVVTPFGEIPWNEVSRFNNDEIRILMLDIEKQILNALTVFSQGQDKFNTIEEFKVFMKDLIYEKHMISWDLSDQEYKKRIKENLKYKEQNNNENAKKS